PATPAPTQPAAPAPTQPAPAPANGPAAPPFIGPTAPPFIGPVIPRHRALGPAAPAQGSTVGTTARPAHRTGLSTPPARRPAPAHNGGVGLAPGADVLPAVHTLVQTSVRHPVAPLALGVLVLLFLLVQHRIDRRDPKLRRVASTELPDLEFGNAVRFA
ncbi:MAG: hypothetical protein QOE99_1962, partial [Actinomycetota bacterium]|nr:hypothetical protein [Actinomycetota bacterium]